jgi:hypothetical protein
MRDNNDAEIRRRLEAALPSLTVAPIEQPARSVRPKLMAAVVATATAALVLVAAILARGTSESGDSFPLTPPPPSSSAGPASPSHSPSARFGPAAYPKPASFPDWGWISGCPSPAGTSEQGSSSTGPVAAVAKLSDGRQQALEASDRALWPVVKRAYHVGDFGPFTNAPLGVFDADRYEKAPIIRSYCGKAVIRASRWVHICAKGSSSCRVGEGGSLAVDFLVLHRTNRWLVWFVEL